MRLTLFSLCCAASPSPSPESMGQTKLRPTGYPKGSMQWKVIVGHTVLKQSKSNPLLERLSAVSRESAHPA